MLRSQAGPRSTPRVDTRARSSSTAGEHKVAAIVEEAERYDLDLDGSFAYSDSVTDLPMLETVGHPSP